MTEEQKFRGGTRALLDFVQIQARLPVRKIRDFGRTSRVLRKQLMHACLMYTFDMCHAE